MTKKILNLLEAASKQNISFNYSAKKNIETFIDYNENKKTISINIQNPDDIKEMEKLENKINEIEKVITY